ncbi:MAG: hypothetical protein LBF91_07515 [Azoarcus sp.]|jgi:alginate biosynthesis protein AlgX|nr:hypothetical protein [Azoarcus sp.]
MRLSRWKVLPLSVLAFAFGLARAAGVPAPVYEVEGCCALCPEARDARRYDTGSLKNSVTLVEGEGDWLFRSRLDLRTDFGTSAHGYRRLRKLRDAFVRRGVEVVLVYLPTRALVHRDKLAPAVRAGFDFDFDLALMNYKALLARFARIGFHVPDLSLLADEHEEQPFYFRADTHWTPYGARRTARVVADAVRRLPAFAGIARREFVSRMHGRMVLGSPGVLRDAAEQLCGDSRAREYTDRFVSRPKEIRDGGDLSGSGGTPQIVLVGTGHSGPAYNFAGFLQEYLGADILNAAMPDGGLDGAMVEYLGSAEFRDAPPKILIWEFSQLYGLEMDSVYRQLLALLDGGCDGKPVLLSGKARLRPGKQEVLLNRAASMFTNREARMEIRFADTSVKNLRADFSYMNGRHESLKLAKPALRDTNGRFVFDLRAEGDWADLTLLSVELEGPEAGDEPQEVELRVCRRQAAAKARGDEEKEPP